ncbi:hypothetical protein BDP27DRAFT_1371821 [Rhodocollybia butyracea]|uniref:Uncharacterized protein n=1 Tax=Rhodocollybia butyracea TaxID=206335 RepID=A0A9P5P966_9AGAR|nr:hypothetical protein BDP27DRAFT_1371821 [Rhodocollybia butyracea]
MCTAIGRDSRRVPFFCVGGVAEHLLLVRLKTLARRMRMWCIRPVFVGERGVVSGLMVAAIVGGSDGNGAGGSGNSVLEMLRRRGDWGAGRDVRLVPTGKAIKKAKNSLGTEKDNDPYANIPGMVQISTFLDTTFLTLIQTPPAYRLLGKFKTYVDGEIRGGAGLEAAEKNVAGAGGGDWGVSVGGVGVLNVVGCRAL